jgi:hypothetical protein
MNYLFKDESKYEEDYENDSDSEYYESESEYYDDDESKNEEKDDVLLCKNIDPNLAKLMGIIIEEQKVIDWKPPEKNGLDNSNEIVSSYHFKNNNGLANLDFFSVIKDTIENFRMLNELQLEYIKNLNNEEKFELIKIYNKIINVSMNHLK